MKTNYIALLVACCALTACDRRSENSTASTSDAATLQAWQDYNDRVKQEQDDYSKQAKSAGEQLQAQADLLKQAQAQSQAQADLHKRDEALMIAQEQMIKRQQDDFARFEKILDTWESQQKQYQTYLDSLRK